MTPSNNTQEFNLQASTLDANEAIKHYIKQATAPYHQQVEDHLSKILFNEQLSIKRYYSVILGMNHSYSAMEKALGKFPLTKELITERSKLEWLKNDITYLNNCGIDTLSTDNNSCQLSIESEAQAMGMLYVMEGATLGGGFIQRRLIAHDWLSKEQGIKFFSNYGKQRMKKWQEFLEILQGFYQNDPSTKSDINDGAAMAFNYIYQSIEKIKP